MAMRTSSVFSSFGAPTRTRASLGTLLRTTDLMQQRGTTEVAVARLAWKHGESAGFSARRNSPFSRAKNTHVLPRADFAQHQEVARTTLSSLVGQHAVMFDRWPAQFGVRDFFVLVSMIGSAIRSCAPPAIWPAHDVVLRSQ